MFETELPEKKERPSKTKQKKIAQATTRFAEDLIKLSTKQLDRLDLPKHILDLLLLAKGNKASGGRSRLVKGASNLIRNDDIWGSEEAMEQYDRIAKKHALLKITPPEQEV